MTVAREREASVGSQRSYGRSGRAWWCYLCGVLAPPVIAAFILAATLVSPGYSHINDTISHLGGQGSPYPWVANAGIFLYGVLVLAFAWGTVLYFHGWGWGRLLGVLVGVNAASVIFASVFETAWGEAQLQASVLASSVHELAARVGFSALTLAMLLAPGLAWKRPSWRGVMPLLLALAISAASFGLLFLFQTFPGYSGLVQRGFFAVCGIWLEVVAIQMLRTKEAPTMYP